MWYAIIISANMVNHLLLFSVVWFIAVRKKDLLKGWESETAVPLTETCVVFVVTGLQPQ